MTTKIKAGVIGDGVVGTSAIADDAVTSAKLDTNIAVAGTLTVTGDANFDSNTLFVDASANAVGIGTSSPSAKLHVQGETTANRTIYIDNTAGQNVSIANAISGGLPSLTMSTAGTEKVRIDSSGNVGVGETSPVAKLHVQGTGTSGQVTSSFLLENASSGTAGMDITGAAGSSRLRFLYGGGPSTGTNTLTEALNIVLEGSSAGNVGIGITNPSTRTHIYSSASSTPLIVESTANTYVGIKNTTQTAYIGAVTSNMIFENNGAERMRLTSTGHLHVNGATADAFHRIVNSTYGEWNTVFYNTAGNPYGLYMVFSGAAPNNASNIFFAMNDTAGSRAVFYSNGGLANYQSNNSNLSDEREKKNIEDLSSTWDCVKSWNIRKFHYNEDEDSDDKRLGVIAQEVETECPEIITEWKKQEQKDEVLWTEEDELPEGVSVGDVKTAAQEEVIRKGVKEQQMYWMAIKALQEAMTEIESLKSRITTLEG